MTSPETFVERLAQRLGGTASAATIFAAPVDRNDVTVIPVARAIAYRFIHWIQADTPRTRWLGVLIWVALTLSFEVVLGRLLGYSWERLFEDYDVRRGGLLSLGMLVLLLSPHLAAKAHEPRVGRVRAIEGGRS